ncbi:hypothetical protein [Xanthomonas phage X2]|nr:hypothetical protein [Xanthomonas phage X2]
MRFVARPDSGAEYDLHVCKDARASDRAKVVERYVGQRAKRARR